MTLNIHHVTFKLIRTIYPVTSLENLESCLSERQYGDRQLGHQKIEDIEKVDHSFIMTFDWSFFSGHLLSHAL